MDLENDYNIVMNHKKIKRIMKKFALVTKVRKAKPYSKILRAAKEHRTVKNLLNRNFDEKTPRKVLLTDITYLYYSNGQRAYLSAVRDLASSEILVYYLSTSIDMEIAYKTLDRLEVVLGETLQPDVMLHSDQGVHYTPKDIPRVLSLLQNFFCLRKWFNINANFVLSRIRRVRYLHSIMVIYQLSNRIEEIIINAFTFHYGYIS